MEREINNLVMVWTMLTALVYTNELQLQSMKQMSSQDHLLEEEDFSGEEVPAVV